MKPIFKQFQEVSLAKIAIMSDIIQAHGLWKIIHWR